VRCHDGSAKGRPDLTARVAKGFLDKSHRAFTESYRALTSGGRQTAFSSWYSSGGICEPLPPYAQGSSVSRLMDHLEPAHHGVQVTDDEKRAVACWLDLGIPFGGSYPEATVWTDDDRRTYEYHQSKRLSFAAAEIAETLGRERPAEVSAFDLDGFPVRVCYAAESSLERGSPCELAIVLIHGWGGGLRGTGIGAVFRAGAAAHGITAPLVIQPLFPRLTILEKGGISPEGRAFWNAS